MMHGRLCITKLRLKVIRETHAPLYVGHCGIDAIVKAAEHFFYWPTLRRDIQEYVRTCVICQKVKFHRHKTLGLL